MANGIDNIDWTKAYYKCVSCDIPCASCAGAGPYHSPDSGLESLVGVEGDKFKCLTCDKHQLINSQNMDKNIELMR